jgi:peroxiredoxin
MQSESIPQVGHVAPDFTLPDSSGHPRRLSELTEKGPLVLIFFRGHW